MRKMQFVYLLMTVSLSNVGISYADNNTDDLKKSVSEKFLIPELFLSNLTPISLTFLNNIPSFGMFQKIFNTSYPPDEINQLFYDSAADFLKSLGFEDYDSVAKMQADVAVKAFEKGITPSQLAISIAHKLEHYLKSKDFKQDEVSRLVESFIQDLIEAVEHYNVKDAKSSLLAITRGSINFYKDAGLKSPEDAKILIEVLGDELNKVSGIIPKDVIPKLPELIPKVTIPSLPTNW